MPILSSKLSDVLTGKVPLPESQPLLKALSQARGREPLVWVLSPAVSLSASMMLPFLEVLESLPAGQPVDLFLESLGASSLETWRVISVLRDRFSTLSALIPFAASPAATQIALGADELVMGPPASLAPLEVARAQDGQRDVLLRALKTHESDEGVLRGVINALASGDLPAKFPLTRRDLGPLGLNVVRPDSPTWTALWALSRHYAELDALEGDLVLGDQRYAVRYDGFLESLTKRRVLITVTRLDESGRPVADLPPLQRWVCPTGAPLEIDREVEL